jgi:hypothetical protein
MRNDAPLLAVLMLTGCVGIAVSDSGVPLEDAGVVTDAGVDAGTRDAGAPPPLDGGHPRLRTLGDNTVLDLGAFACTDPSGSGNLCASVTDYSSMVYDSNNHQLLLFGGGHATTMTDTVFWFDLNDTLRWHEFYPPTPCSQMTTSNIDQTLGAWRAGTSGPYPRPLAAHTFDQLAFAPAQNDFVLVGRFFTGGTCGNISNDIGGPVAHFALTAGTWSFAAKSATRSSTLDGTEFDPVSGKVLLFGATGLGFYDPATRQATLDIDAANGGQLKNTLGQKVGFSGLSYGNDLVYFPPTDTFYYFVRGTPVETYALKLNRANLSDSTLDLVATTGPTSNQEEPGYAYDSHNQIIGGGVTANRFYAFDPVSKTWAGLTVQGGTPGDQAFLAVNYDPVSNVFIFVTSRASGAHTWAYRYKN